MEIENIENVKFEDWKKLDIRIGKILEVRVHPNANKLYILKVDVGKEIEIVTGLKDDYSKDDLEDRMVVIFVNLEPKKIRGIKSNGMILAAVDGEKISLLRPDKIIKAGTKIE